MSKFADQLRERCKVFNNYEMLKSFGEPGDVAIEYYRPAPGRLGLCETNRTTVWSPLKTPHLTLSSRRLRDYPEKDFLGRRAESLPAALEWAKATFGHVYVTSPFGGYLPKHVVEKARAAVEKVKEAST